MTGDALSYAKGTLHCSVDIDLAWSFLGHSGQAIGADLKTRLEALAQRCENEHTPRYLWKTMEIEKREDGVTFKESDLALPGASIKKHLAEASHATLLAVTIGVAWKQTISQLNATSPTDALLYDACTNALTETAAEEAHRLLARAAAASDFEAHARFSPGYGDLPLSVQPAFLREIDAPRKIGVIATEKSFLEPAKSITAVVGLHRQGTCRETNDEDRCEMCAAHDYCNFRERNTTCYRKTLRPTD